MRNLLIGAIAALGLVLGTGCRPGSQSDYGKQGEGTPAAGNRTTAPSAVQPSRGQAGTGGSGQAASAKGQSGRSWYPSDGSAPYQAPHGQVLQAPVVNGDSQIKVTGQGSKVGGGGISGQAWGESYQGGTIGGPGVSADEPSSAINSAQNATAVAPASRQPSTPGGQGGTEGAAAPSFGQTGRTASPDTSGSTTGR